MGEYEAKLGEYEAKRRTTELLDHRSAMRVRGRAGQVQSSSMGELELPPATEARESSEEELGPCTATKAKARSEEELEPRTATDTKGRRREELNPLIATKTGGAVERSCCRPPPLRPWGAGSKSWTSL